MLDFGQNIAGYIAFTVTAKEGQEVFLRFGEMLMRTGSLPRKIFSVPTRKRHRLCSRCAIPAKRGENHYKTSFAIFGFQLATD